MPRASTICETQENMQTGILRIAAAADIVVAQFMTATYAAQPVEIDVCVGNGVCGMCFDAQPCYDFI